MRFFWVFSETCLRLLLDFFELLVGLSLCLVETFTELVWIFSETFFEFLVRLKKRSLNHWELWLPSLTLTETSRYLLNFHWDFFATYFNSHWDFSPPTVILTETPRYLHSSSTFYPHWDFQLISHFRILLFPGFYGIFTYSSLIWNEKLVNVLIFFIWKLPYFNDFSGHPSKY